MQTFVQLIVVGLLVGLLTACASGERAVSTEPSQPRAAITSPANGSSATVGEPVTINFAAADVNGVAQVEVSVDGQVASVQPVEPAVNSFNGRLDWVFETPGTHSVQVIAFNVDGEPSDPAQILLNLTQPPGAVTATPVPVAEEPTATPVPVEPTATPTLVAPTDTPESEPNQQAETLPTETPAPTATPVEAGTPFVTMVTNLNVRSGPGVNYPVIGRMAEGTSAEIVGRDETASWWQIVYITETGDRGWVSADAQFSTAQRTGQVPVAVAEAPPPPPATPTNTPEPPTPTPLPGKPVIYSFTADRYEIDAGDVVELRWDLENAREAFLRYDGNEVGVVSPGERDVSPQRETTYRLVARNENGETIAELTITVDEEAANEVVVYRDGKVTVAPNQSVDFDRGLVRDGVESGFDFYWDAASYRIIPESGASGAVKGQTYGTIDYEDCVDTSYGDPIGDVGLGDRVTGCYITSEDRYGKFWVSDWDEAGNLTIEWLTWED